MNTALAQNCEVNFQSRYWMIELAKASRRAEKVIVRNFRPTSQNIGFVKAISNENHFFISSWDEDLVMERVASGQAI